MLFDFTPHEAPPGEWLIESKPTRRWGVDSEYGQLRDVLVSAPLHLEMVPCNDVTRDNLGRGIVCCPDAAAEQHLALVETLQAHGVRCHFVPPAPGLPDLSFTRDSVLMTPWGLLELNSRLAHRRAEAAHVAAAANVIGVPRLGGIGEGFAEGGDISVIAPGVVAIGFSGDRTDEAGARAVAAVFEAHKWQVIYCRFSSRYLHLDTLFTMVDRDRAVACVEELDVSFLFALVELGIELIPVPRDEILRLGANLVSLGEGRVLSAADNVRVNGLLTRMGYDVVPVEVSQFTRCGGGIHCLTNPLFRLPG
jgi:arginine deiminase